MNIYASSSATYRVVNDVDEQGKPRTSLDIKGMVSLKMAPDEKTALAYFQAENAKRWPANGGWAVAAVSVTPIPEDMILAYFVLKRASLNEQTTT